MRIIRTLLILAMAVVCCRAQFNKALTEEEATAKLKCVSHIVCNLYEGYVFKRVIDKADEELLKNALIWLTTLYDMEMPSNFSDDYVKSFFDSYSERVCTHTEEQRKDADKEFSLEVYNYCDSVCENNFNAKECEGCNRVQEEFDAIITEYTEKGECNNARETDNEKAMEKGMEKFPGG